MKPYLELKELSYDGIGRFIEHARQSEDCARYLLGKSAAYTDIAYALGQITELEALELLTCVKLGAAQDA